jgi:AP-4 complex subunit beta-1
LLELYFLHFLSSLKKRLAIETRDLVIKKMVYLYLTNYARTHPELAQMCTNTLQKDCGNEDPMVRGLALRALCGLSLPQMVEYISEPLRRSLNDGHAYVRKTGVMGSLKLYHLDAEAFEAGGFVDILYDMLRDVDASVVANCIIVLNEVMQKSPHGGMAINRAIMLHLLNRIHEFNDFAKVQVLDLVARYIPANPDEGFQIMNLLDPVLQSASSAAVMATVKAFLSLADHLEAAPGSDYGSSGAPDQGMKRQIVIRVKPCLVTQISAGSSEIMYTLLKHVAALTETCPGVFDDEYRQFYCRYNEPTNVKYLKVCILPNLANPDTAPDIVAELAELVAADGPHVKLSRLAVRSMGKIACSGRGGDGAPEAIARRLVEMMDFNVQHISSEAATALALMLRKQPTALKPLIAPPLVRSLKYMQEPTGKASIIFLLGECGDIIPEAPYALEKLIDSYEKIDKHQYGVCVKLALLNATMKLFFLRPPEVQKMLGRLLQKATDDVSSQDLHDRALYCYRMLRCGSLSASASTTLESIVKTNTSVPEGVKFAEEDDYEVRTEIMQEFDSLSIIYGKTSVNFIDEEYQVKYVKMPEDHPLPEAAMATAAASAPGGPPAPVAAAAATDPYYSATAEAAPVAAAASFGGGEVDLLGGFGEPAAPSPPRAGAAASATASSSSFLLNPSVTMTGDEYQSKWASIPDGQAIVSMIMLQTLPTSTEQVELALASRAQVQTMASGELPAEFKFFLYAQDVVSGCTFLIQTNVDKSAAAVEPMMIVTVKVVLPEGSSLSPQRLVDQLVEKMGAALRS